MFWLRRTKKCKQNFHENRIWKYLIWVTDIWMIWEVRNRIWFMSYHIVCKCTTTNKLNPSSHHKMDEWMIWIGFYVIKWEVLKLHIHESSQGLFVWMCVKKLLLK